MRLLRFGIFSMIFLGNGSPIGHISKYKEHNEVSGIWTHKFKITICTQIVYKTHGFVLLLKTLQGMTGFIVSGLPPWFIWGIGSENQWGIKGESFSFLPQLTHALDKLSNSIRLLHLATYLACGERLHACEVHTWLFVLGATMDLSFSFIHDLNVSL